MKKKIELAVGYAKDLDDPFIIKPGLILRGICPSSPNICVGSGQLVCLNIGLGGPF